MKKIILIFCCLFFTACVSKFLSSGNNDIYHLRPHTEETLGNGLKVLFVQDPNLPKVRLTILLKVGAVNDPKDREGLGYLTSALLEDGTVKLNANQLADEFGYLAADYSASLDQEKTILSVSSLNDNRDQTLKLFVDVLTGPAFSESEVSRRKSRLVANLKKITENPSHYADLLLNQAIFNQHPYGRMVSGTPKSVTSISRSDIVRHYFKYFRPENATLAVAGDFDENYKEKVRKSFAVWPNGAAINDSHSLPVDSGSTALRLYTKKGLQQSQIRIGGLSISRQDPDHLPLRIASLILGGTFESRLMIKIRAEMGLTYSISSSFNEMKDGGAFEISTFSRHDKAAEVIKQTRIMLNDFVKNGVSSHELESAKTLMISQFPASVETSSETASTLLQLRFFGIQDSYLEEFKKNVNRVSLSEVNDAIRRHLKPELFKTVVFSDAAEVGESLKMLGSLTVEPVEN